MEAGEFLATVIRPALSALGRGGTAAEQLLLGTACQESDLIHTVQMGGGPALGYFQMEPRTHDDIWANYLRFRQELADKARALAGDANPVATLLRTNHPYAAAMARIHYARVPEALPAAGDAAGMARYWKQHYNTPEGAGHEDEFIAKWRRFKIGELFAGV